MNKENFRSIVISLKPDNICVNPLDYVKVIIPDFAFKLDLIDEKIFVKNGLVATFLGAKMWTIYPESSVDRNHIRICSGDQISFYDLEWSLPICLDWHLNDIKRMWNLKAFW